MSSFSEMSDGTKLRVLANWFDGKDDINGIPKTPEKREVQFDLRRMAERLEKLDEAD